jgi:hypothetical protein
MTRFEVINMFNTVVIRSNRVILACVLSVSIISSVNCFAQSYWDAIFQLGYDPVTQDVNQTLACRRIEGIYRFRELISNNLTADQDLLIKIRDLDSRITSLDVANVYEFLPYSDADGVWRAIGVRGQSDVNAYRLNVVDPNIEEWLNSSSDDDTRIAGSQDHFGDIGLGIFIRPFRKETFRFLTEVQLYLADIPAGNVIRVFNGMLTTTWAYAAGEANLPTAIIEENALDRQSVKILNGISNDFPDFFRITTQYYNIENIVSSNNKNAEDSLAFNIRVRLNREAFSLHYPEIGKILKKWREIVQFKARIFNKQDQLMGMVELDSTNNLFTIQFRILSDRFISMHDDGILKINNGFSLTAAGSTQFKVVCDIHLNIVGMQLKIDALPVVLDYRHSDGGPRLKARLVQAPQKIEAGGSVYGFIPIWMVDLLIPSNVQEIMNSFFQTLAKGNDGNGSVIRIYSFPEQAPKQSFLLNTDAEVPANGTIKLGFNLQRKFFAMPPEVLVEIRAFKKQLWHGLYRDYQRIKIQRGYQ